jgi:hypothetical protein
MKIKPKNSRRKKIIKVRAETNKIDFTNNIGDWQNQKLILQKDKVDKSLG